MKLFSAGLLMFVTAACSDSNSFNATRITPVAAIAGPQTASREDVLEFSGQDSALPGGQTAGLQYEWHLASVPADSRAVLQTDGDEASLVPDELGLYQVELVVSFAGVASEPEQFVSHVNRATLLTQTFDTPSFAPFIYGGAGASGAAVVDGALRISPGTQGFPDRGFVYLALSLVSVEYHDQLMNLEHPLEISFSIANQDLDVCGGCNNQYIISLSSTQDRGDARQFSYEISGGVFTTNRFVFRRASSSRSPFGNTGSAELIELNDGIGNLPEVGAFRLRYEPADSTWSLFFEKGTTETDPREVTTLVGSVTDDLFVDRPLPYLVFTSQFGRFAELLNLYIELKE